MDRIVAVEVGETVIVSAKAFDVLARKAADP
jgi:hypothetical protein